MVWEIISFRAEHVVFPLSWLGLLHIWFYSGFHSSSTLIVTYWPEDTFTLGGVALFCSVGGSISFFSADVAWGFDGFGDSLTCKVGIGVAMATCVV